MKRLLLFIILLFLILISLAGYDQRWLENAHMEDEEYQAEQIGIE